MRELDGGVPPELDELVARLLDRDKDARPQSAAEVRELLRNLLLGATLQAVASGEHELPRLSTIELTGTADREPTPLGIPLPGRNKDATVPPIVGAAPTGQAHAPVRRATAVATAKTALALGQMKKQVERTSLPVGLIGIGCAGLAVLTLGIVGIALAVGGDDPPPLVKHEHSQPLPPPPEPEQPETTEGGEAAVPQALAQPMADLLISDETRTRRRAASAVMDYQPQTDVPPFLVAVAELERGRSCRQKKEKVEELQQIGDPRAIPVLERLDAEPHDGCHRLFRRYDCYHCLRDELQTALTSLRGQVND